MATTPPTTPLRLLESADVGRRFDPVVGPARVSAMARDGEIVPYAVTARGVKLFTEDEVRRVQRLRAAKRERLGHNR